MCPIMWREDLVCMRFRAWPQNLGPEVWNNGTARGRLVNELRETACAMFRTRVQYRLRIWFLANLRDKRFERRCLPYFLNATNTRVRPYLLAAQEPEMTIQEEEMDEIAATFLMVQTVQFESQTVQLFKTSSRLIVLTV